MSRSQAERKANRTEQKLLKVSKIEMSAPYRSAQEQPWAARTIEFEHTLPIRTTLHTGQQYAPSAPLGYTRTMPAQTVELPRHRNLWLGISLLAAAAVIVLVMNFVQGRDKTAAAYSATSASVAGAATGRVGSLAPSRHSNPLTPAVSSERKRAHGQTATAARSPEAELQEADHLMQLGSFGLALETLAPLERHPAYHSAALLLHAKVLYQQAQFSDAAAMATEVLAQGGSESAYLVRANSFMRLENWDRASADFRSYLARHPEHREAQQGLALVQRFNH